MHSVGVGEDEPISISDDHLTVIGAGPKAVAIAAKRRALDSLGAVVPQLCVIDPKGIAAHWTGEHGYTDGGAPLGTPPEKDVGFPYASRQYGNLNADQAVDAAMLRYSWPAFRVLNQLRDYADWVDRGKPAPRHGQWAEYLDWAADRAGLEVLEDRVVSIELAGERWRLRLGSGSPIETNGLVITNPGPAKSKFDVGENVEWVFDGADFWLRESQQKIRDLASGEGQTVEACVIGSGETAAAVVVQLVRLLPPESPITIVSRGGIVYTRGESHDENRLYSDPAAWLEFSETIRREFVRRTDRGVFSVTNKAIVNQTHSIVTIAGDVRAIRQTDVQGLLLELDDGPHPTTYDLVVDATGFQVDWFLDLMDAPATEALARAVGFDPADSEERRLQRLIGSIGPDLAVEGLQPRLHLPMLSAFRQGPGFPNLSCLGLLSDRILQQYCVTDPLLNVKLDPPDDDDIDSPEEDLSSADP